jgi:hypothetical protein
MTDREILLAKIQERLARKLERFFHQQKNMFMAGFERFSNDFPEPKPELQEAKLPPGTPPNWEDIWDYVSFMTVGVISGDVDEALKASMQKAGLAPMGTVNMSPSFTLANPKAVEYLNRYGADLVTRVNQATKDQLRTIISHATEEGWSYSKTSKEIRSKFNSFSERKPQLHIRNRAELIAVTETGNAYERAAMIQAESLQMAGLPMEKSWNTVGDDRVSDGCQENEDAGWIPIDEPFPSGDMQPLRFPGCLPAGQIVVAEGILGATKRLFNGELVVITTTKGEKFSCTPNHPVLTPTGWVGAGFLNEGDQLVCRSVEKLLINTPNIDYENVPTRIEKVVHAFRLSRKLSPEPMKVTSPDFHGDGSGSKIAIIWSNSSLGNSVNSSIKKFGLYYKFTSTNIAWICFSAKSTFTTFLKRAFSTLRSFMSSLTIPGILFRRSLGHHQSVCIGLPANVNIGFSKSFSYASSGNTKGSSNRVFGFAGNVSGDDLFDGQDEPAWINNDMFFIDTVSSIKRRKFIGHVYNLHTVCGYYSTSTVVMHNCRCNLQTRFAREDR